MPAPRNRAVEDVHVRDPQQVVQKVEDQPQDPKGQDQRDEEQQASDEAEPQVDPDPLPRLAARCGIGQSLEQTHRLPSRKRFPKGVSTPCRRPIRFSASV